MPLALADNLRLALLRTNPAPDVANQALQGRITSESIVMAPTVTNSNELDPSFQVKDSIVTGAQTGGSIDFELSRNPFFDELLAAASAGKWGVGTYNAVAVGANGLIPARQLNYYTIEKRWTMPDASFSYHRYLNSAISGIALAITPGEPITGSATVAGGPMENPISITALPAITYLSPGTLPIMTAPLVTELTVDAGTVLVRCFGTFNLSIVNNVRGVQCIGTLGEREKVLGRVEVTMTGTVYFASNDMLTHLLNQDSFLVDLKLTDSTPVTPHFYDFAFPRCKVTAASVVAGGTGTDVLCDMTIQALYDTAKGATFKVDRSVQAFTLLFDEE